MRGRSFERHVLLYLVSVCRGTLEIADFMERIQEVSVEGFATSFYSIT